MLILKYCNDAFENCGLFAFFLLSPMAGALLAQIFPGHLADTICYPGSGGDQGSLKGGTAWPWTNPAASGKLSQDGHQIQKVIH